MKELFWSVFSRIQTEYGQCGMRKNTDQSNPKYGHFLRSDWSQYFKTLSDEPKNSKFN